MKTRTPFGPNTTLLFVVTWLLGVNAVGPAGQAGRQQAESQRPVTFTKDVAPILQRSCQNCHRPGSIAPMPLINYEDARPWAKAIKQKTSLREMPPWYIEKNIGIQKFKDDISLRDEEIATLATWADSGAPRGNAADMPPPIRFADTATWSIGTPDLIVSSPVHTLKAVAADWYGLLDGSPTGLTEDRYIQAVEVKEVRLAKTSSVQRAAGDLNLWVLHHAVISSRARPSDDEEPATQTSGDPSRSRESDAFSITYEVGQNATTYQDGLSIKLAAGSDINWDLHLHSIGTEMPFRIDVGFKLHPRGYKPKYVGTGGLDSRLTFDLDIPPSEANVRLEGITRVTKPGMLATFEPHLHSSGKRMCVEAIYPSGLSEMLNCAGYNHNWVKVYVYEDDVAPLLPEGTLLRIIAWYDNTAKNPRVVDPRNWKGYGNRSTDDMFLLLSRFVPMTDEQFKQEVASRQAKQRVKNTTAQQQ